MQPSALASAVVTARDQRWWVTSKEIPETALRRLISRATAIFESEPAILELSEDLHIIGDIHGNVDCFLQILTQTGWPPHASFLCLGDYVDRGEYSCEVIILLYALKVLYPSHVFLLRGNHESTSVAQNFGFREECVRKFSLSIYERFMESFEALPVAAVANGWFCVHGGISERAMTMSRIREIDKVADGRENAVVCDFLWSDPEGDVRGFAPNPRGLGHLFGADSVDRFLEECDLIGIIRAHQLCDAGFGWPFSEDGGVLTVFSSYDYQEAMNDAGYVVLLKGGKVEIKVVPATTGMKKRPPRIARPPWMIETGESIVFMGASLEMEPDDLLNLAIEIE
jgi:diadenosine tetraphosphatase ApaH/serine/threonine PP2A family protein phosphatase